MAWVSDPVIPKKPNQRGSNTCLPFLFELGNVAEPRDHHATFSNTEVLGTFWKTETLNLLPFQKEMSFSNPIDFQGWSVSFSGVYNYLILLPWVWRSWWSWRHVFWSIPNPSERVLEVHNWIRLLMRIWKGYSPIHFEMKKSPGTFEMKAVGENNQSAGHKPSAIPSKHLKTGPREAACWRVWERICASMSWENENCRLVEYTTNIFKKDCA